MRTIRDASLIICLLCLGAVSSIGWAAPAPNAAPSFSCTATRLSPTEQQICGNAELAGYDRELAALYQAKLQEASAVEKPPLIQDQRAWLQKRNACRDSLDCIKGAYLTKIYDLQTSSSPEAPVAADSDQAAQVNAAIPLSGSAQTALSEAQHRVDDKVMLAGIQSQLALKMKLRALNCVQTLGIAPGLSSQQLHDSYGGNPCFAKQDDDIAKWLGMRTVGYLLTLPPLRPVPAAAPQSITDTEGNIMSAHLATQAGIAVLQSGKDVEVIDIARDTPINSRLRQDDGPLTGVSPNGRIYVSSTNRGLRFYSSEDGTLLADSGLNEYATLCGLPWLDPLTILTRDPNSFGTSAIYDFASGSFTPMDSGLANVNCIVPAPGAGDTSVGFGNLVSRFRLVHGSDGKPYIDVLQAKQTNLFISRRNAGLAAGGRQFIYVTKDQLGITDLGDLSTQTIDFGNYAVQDVWPTTDPDRIIVTGIMKHRAVANSDPAPLYEYAIREQTMSLVDTSILGSKRFLYYPQQSALYVMRNSSLTRVDGLQVGPPESLSSFWSDIAKAEAPPRSNFTVLPPGAVQYTTAGGQVTGVYTAPSQAQTDALHLLARNASVDGFSLIEADRGPPVVATVVQPSSPAPQVVHVKLHSRRNPLVLVLTANSSVVWQLDTPSNALLMAVLLSGASGSSVQGQGNAEVVNIGSAYSFTPGYSPSDGRPGYADLQAEVYTYTGRHIGLFQGGGPDTWFNAY